MSDAVDAQDVRALTEGQTAALEGLPALVHRERGSRRLALLAQRLARILQDTVWIAERHQQAWRVRAVHTIARPQPVDEEFWPALDDASNRRELRIVKTGQRGCWTVVALSLSGTRRVVLVLAGDWRSAAAPLSAFADQITAACRHRRRTAKALRRSSYQLAQRLSKTHGIAPVATMIVEAMATAVRARLAALAVVDPNSGRLSIKATFGYPLMLVEHMRIEAGEGIFGSASESGRVLRMPGGRRGPTPSGRPRYRTDSYIALPIAAGNEVLAVVCVADRVDDRAFTRADLLVMQALAAPAALALARERAAARADAYAHAAAVDPLSGLFNRRYFQVRLEEELQRSRRHEAPIALLMIDVDDFKAVNDTHGHLTGDLVIKETADIIRRAVRVFDVCTRFGGEEFAVIMPASTEENALSVAERIRSRVAAFRPSERPLRELQVSVSIGVSLSTSNTAPVDMIRRADEALYAAKRSGKNQVKVAAAAAAFL